MKTSILLLALAVSSNLCQAFSFELYSEHSYSSNEYGGRHLTHASGSGRWGGRSWSMGAFMNFYGGVYSDRTAFVSPEACNDIGTYVGEPAVYMGPGYGATTINGDVLATENRTFLSVNNSDLAVGNNELFNLRTGVSTAFSGFIGRSINDLNVVAGFTGAVGSERAAIWRNGVITPLALPSGASRSVALVTSRSGSVFGFSGDSGQLTQWDTNGNMVRQYDLHQGSYLDRYSLEYTDDGILFLHNYYSPMMIGETFISRAEMEQSAAWQIGTGGSWDGSFGISFCTTGGNLVLSRQLYWDGGFGYNHVYQVVRITAPEPTTLTMIGAGAVLGLYSRRRRS